MTPLALEMLIWARTRFDFCAFPNLSCAPQQEIFASFRETGVLDERYRLTPLGDAWLSSILATPLPLMRFVDPRTNEVVPHDR